LIPYVFHCIEGAKKLWDWGVDDEDVLCAMVNHDTEEDCGVTPATIEHEFNKHVASIVTELTFIPPSDPKEKAAAKAVYMATFAQSSVEALTCKLADRICNVRDKLTGGNKSVNEYFHKADVLFAAWQARKAEIVERFGQSVQDCIQADYDRLVADLG
jgi:(p)ppGpp synthase/HD superfamily hydrolase